MDVPSCNRRLDKLFDSNDTGDAFEYGRAFQSNGEVLEIIDRLNYLIEKQNKLPPKVLLKKTQQLYDRADVLVRRCKVITDDNLCSKESRKVMSTVFYDIASELTLYGRLSYNLISTQSALTDSLEKIIAIG